MESEKSIFEFSVSTLLTILPTDEVIEDQNSAEWRQLIISK